jgi:hypothetical protein
MSFRLPPQLSLSLRLEHVGSREVLPPQGFALAELFADGVVLDVPPDFCGQGESLRLHLETSGLGGLGGSGREIRASLGGRVARQSFAGARGTRDTVWLVLDRPDAPGWRELRELLEGRQSAVERVFAALKE